MLLEVTAIGRLGRDSESRYTPNGDMVCSFSMACDVGYGQNKKTSWVKVTLWRKLAESLGQYLTKGQVVFVQGSLQVADNGECRTWTDQSGKVHATFEIKADAIKLLPGGPKRGEGEDDDSGAEAVHPNVAQVVAQADVPF